ncbi:MAG: hypothetical protein KDI03_16755 [Anaerolineae bacterium]|nr:hypothetical protein [Anaerolineae bacterium]
MPAAGVTAVPFDLGETNLEQTWVANENLRNMPVRLEGMIAAPAAGDELPIAVLIHGSHGVGCPADEMDEVQVWPCPDDENHHYEGFAYLLEALAEQGFVAMSIDANPAFVAAFGDPADSTNPRLVALFDLYLAQIAAAVDGEAVDFGVDLAGRVDLNQLVVLGHSQGGAGTVQIVYGRADHTTTEQVNAGQGPIAAAILLAPEGSAPEDRHLPVPFAVILPECDRDVAGLAGQGYYEDARQATQRDDLAASIYLHHANHNRFNSALGDETLGNASVICDQLLPAADAQSFLASYATQFFDWALGRGEDNTAALGLDATQPAPDALLGVPALTSLALPTSQRLTLPLGEEGRVGTATAVHCEKGFIADEEKRGPCGYYQLKQPGLPDEMAISWDGQGGAYEVTVPADSRDLSTYDVLHFRTVVNPVSELNAAGDQQSFSVQLEDGAGKTTKVTVTNEPALAFPSGEMGFDDFWQVNTWDNHVILSSVRIPLSVFSGIDLTDVQTISLVFDATDSGAIFLTDLELLR